MGFIDRLFKKDREKSSRTVGFNFNENDADEIFDELDKHDLKELKKTSEGMKKEINQAKEISKLLKDGESLEKSGNDSEAIKTYEKIIVIEPDAYEAYEKLADIYHKRNDVENEIKVLKLGIKNIKSNKNKLIERLKKIN